MNKKGKSGCALPAADAGSCCKIESLISVDEKGQMVLPKDLRERAEIHAGEKMALISWEKDGAICCFTLIKAGYLAERVKDFLGPVMQGLYKPENT